MKIEGKIKNEVKDVVKSQRGVQERMNGGVELMMKKKKIDVIWGEEKIVKDE